MNHERHLVMFLSLIVVLVTAGFVCTLVWQRLQPVIHAFN